MKKIIISLGLAISALALTPYSFAQSTQSFSANLTGGEEVPPVTTTTRGSVQVTPNRLTSAIAYKLSLYNTVGVTAAHLHCGVKGQNGPVVAFLFGQGGGSQVNGTVNVSANDLAVESSGTTCSPAINNKTDLIQALNDGRIYANAHSVSIPSGVVRGQLAKAFSFNTSTNTSTSQFANQIRQQNQQLIQQLKEGQQALFDQLFGGQ